MILQSVNIQPAEFKWNIQQRSGEIMDSRNAVQRKESEGQTFKLIVILNWHLFI